MSENQHIFGLADAVRVFGAFLVWIDTSRGRGSRVTRSTIAIVAIVVLLLGCEHENRLPPQQAAALTGDFHGADLIVSPEQQNAIGLATEQVLSRELRNSLNTTGWLVARPGREVVVRAPLAGFITPLSETNTLSIGQAVSRQQSLARLHVFLSPQEEAQIVAAKEDADTVIRQSLASLEIARGQLQRLEQETVPVVRETRLQELREIIARSQAAHDEAMEKLPFLPYEPYGEKLKLREVPIPAPINGHVMRVEVNPRQFVLQGDPLWTVADWSKLWVRVPVFVADLPRLARQQAIGVLIAGTRTARAATPVDWPQPSQPGRQTVDLYFEIDNARNELRPGQAVEVALPLGDRVTRLTVAHSAILWGEDGDAAVYVKLAPDRFRRRNVLLGPPFDDQAVVREGVKEGDVVVSIGAEALYAEEFRWQIPREDEEEEGD